MDASRENGVLHTDVEREGLEIVLAGLEQGLYRMGPDCLSYKALTPLLNQLRWRLGQEPLWPAAPPAQAGA